MKLGDVIKMGHSKTIIIDDSQEYTIAGVQSYGQGVVNRRNELGKNLKMKKYQVIEPNYLMWCKVDTKNGAFGITKEEHSGSLASTNMALAQIDITKINPRFLERLFTFQFFHGNITHLSSGSTNRKYLTPKQLCQLLEIPDLTKEEQDQFIELVDRLEQLETSSEFTHQLTLLKQLRQAFLREAMQGKLVAQDPQDEPAAQLLAKIKAEKERLIGEKKIKKEKEVPPIGAEEVPFEVPEGWVWCRLGEAANMVFDGPFGSHLKTADYTSFGVQVIRLENLGQMKFIHEKETFVSFEKYGTIKSHEVFEGDVIIGSFLADGVRCVILPKLQGKAIAKADCFTIRLNVGLFLEYV